MLSCPPSLWMDDCYFHCLLSHCYYVWDISRFHVYFVLFFWSCCWWCSFGRPFVRSSILWIIFVASLEYIHYIACCIKLWALAWNIFMRCVCLFVYQFSWLPASARLKCRWDCFCYWLNDAGLLDGGSLASNVCTMNFECIYKKNELNIMHWPKSVDHRNYFQFVRCWFFSFLFSVRANVQSI